MQPLEFSTPVKAFVLSGGEIDATWAPLPTTLEFSLADPLAATLVLGAGSPTPVTWNFAFDLLNRVCTGSSTAGVGDVRFTNDPDMKWVILRLSSPEGCATLRLDLLDIKKYVHAVKSALDSNQGVDIVSEALDRAIYVILEG